MFCDRKDIICDVTGIDISKTYHFAVSLYQINDEICLMDYVVDGLIILKQKIYADGF